MCSLTSPGFLQVQEVARIVDHDHARGRGEEAFGASGQSDAAVAGSVQGHHIGDQRAKLISAIRGNRGGRVAAHERGHRVAPAPARAGVRCRQV
jgi:hypothetical protein